MGHKVSMPLAGGLQGYWIGFQQDAGSAGLYRIGIMDSGMPVGFSLDVVVVREDFPGNYTGLDRRLSKGLDRRRS
jgi:hypothetical protein